jgi:hypothetical protein
VVLHPLWGMLLLAATMFLMFQAVFSWAAVPMEAIKSGVGGAGPVVQSLPDGALRSLLVDGIVAGAGGVLVFLPQILILFFFILALEDSGYLPRAAFLLDRVMGSVGLSGRSFIPLLSSFACAMPGHHGHAHHHPLARAAGHHHDRAAHDLLGAPAGVCAADRRLHPRAHGGGPVQPAGPGDVRAVRGRHPQRHGRGGRAQALARHGAAHAAA